MLSFASNCLQYTLQAITVLHVLFVMSESVLGDCLLLLGNEVLQFVHLGHQPFELLHISLDAVVFLTGVLQAIWIWVGGIQIWHSKVGSNANNLGSTSLLE